MNSPRIPSPSDHATEIVECIRASIRANGLNSTLEDFKHMEHLLSGLPWWNEVKTRVYELFAQERERLEQLELARAKAGASTVYQLLPTAGIGVAERIDQLVVGDAATLNH